MPIAALAVAVGAGTPGPAAPHHDVVIRNGTVDDGGGRPPVVADVAVNGDRIAAISLGVRITSDMYV